jgi:hypothetical protein
MRSISGIAALKEIPMNILMVLTSHDALGDTGRKTGFWLEEFASPYYVFKDAGANITITSPKGGRLPVDPKSNDPQAQTVHTRRFEVDMAAGPASRLPPTRQCEAGGL